MEGQEYGFLDVTQSSNPIMLGIYMEALNTYLKNNKKALKFPTPPYVTTLKGLGLIPLRIENSHLYRLLDYLIAIDLLLRPNSFSDLIETADAYAASIFDCTDHLKIGWLKWTHLSDEQIHFVQGLLQSLLILHVTK